MCHKMMTIAQIVEPLASLDSGHRDISRVALYLGPWTRDHFFGQFWKLGFFSISECPIFAHRGRLCKFLDRELVASVPTWNLPKQAYMTHQNLVLMHVFHSMPQVGIQHVSLKACSRWDSTCDKIMAIARFDKTSNSLY